MGRDERNGFARHLAHAKSNERFGSAEESRERRVIVPVLAHCSSKGEPWGDERGRDRVRHVFNALALVPFTPKRPLGNFVSDKEIDIRWRASAREPDARAPTKRNGRSWAAPPHDAPVAEEPSRDRDRSRRVRFVIARGAQNRARRPVYVSKVHGGDDLGIT